MTMTATGFSYRCDSRRAQQSKKVARIGYLTGADAATESARSERIRLALRERGYIEGQNIATEYGYAEGKRNQLPALAAELVRLNVKPGDVRIELNSPTTKSKRYSSIVAYQTTRQRITIQGSIWRFANLQRHRSEASASRFYVFDLLRLRDRSMLHERLLKRRDALIDLLHALRKKPSVIDLSQTVTASTYDMIRAITELGLESIMVKRQDSHYESGKRSGAWVKYKVNKGQKFVVGGYTPGNPFDAIIIGFYKGDNLL